MTGDDRRCGSEPAAENLSGAVAAHAARDDGIDPGRSAVVALLLTGGAVAANATERPITVDQTNYSVVVGEHVVVKWLRPPVEGVHPAVRAMTHLRSVGFDEMPQFHGAFVDGGATVAIVTGFVTGALDGWDWFVDELTHAAASGDLARPLHSAEAIGALSGRLHRALATPSETIAETVRGGSLAVEAARGSALLAESRTSEVVAPRASEIEQLLKGLAGLDEDAAVQPIHGDLHVGQILRSPDGLFVNDFDGSPVGSADERLRRRSPLVDVASVLQSLDHVGRIVTKRRPDLGAAIDVFLAAAPNVALSAYRQVVGGDERSATIDDDALFTLRVVQELHEFVYAQRSLPRWRYVPEAALAALLPR